MTHDLVDWDLAVTIGARIAGDGPEVSRAEADAVVAELRADAARSTGLVQDFTGLVAPPDTAPVLVVDRRGWLQANADAFAHLLAPVADRVTGSRAPGPVARAIGSRLTGAEVGGLLGFLGTKVLGQFDPFSPDQPHGRLLLVAPNIVHVERELEVDPADFRLWVTLHEETHRVQFTATPWLKDHLYSMIGELADTLPVPGEGGGGLDDIVGRVTEALKAAGSSASGSGLLGAFASPAQRDLLDRVTGVMSLLEGHADVVMDGVGPSVIPSVAHIRSKFTERRKGVGTLDKVLRKLLGLDVKMAQYRDGAVFVRGVVDEVGMERFNAVFAEAGNLPSKAEIHDHEAWIRRVL